VGVVSDATWFLGGKVLWPFKDPKCGDCEASIDDPKVSPGMLSSSQSVYRMKPLDGKPSKHKGFTVVKQTLFKNSHAV